MSTTIETNESKPVDPILIDGLWVDPDTGEIVGCENADLNLDAKPETGWTFDQVNWVMERALKRESLRRSADLRLAPLLEKRAALIEEHMKLLESDPDFLEVSSRISHLEGIQESASKGVASLIDRFKGMLMEFAQAHTTPKKRTVQTEFGNLQLVKSRDKIEVIDEQQAIDWLLMNDCGDAIKRSVLTSKLTEESIAKAHADGESGIEVQFGQDDLKVKFG